MKKITNDDCRKEISKINRSSFNAKIAAINGFSVFGKEYTYIINQDDTINYDKINEFLKKFGDEPFLSLDLHTIFIII